MRVKSEDILKPGAVLTVERIDFDDPKNQWIKDMKRQARIMRRNKNRPFKNYVITI